MIDIIMDNIELTSTLIILAVAGSWIVRRGSRKKRTALAAEVFKVKVLAELEGLYPIPRYLEKDVCDKFRGSIPAIESAAAEFRKVIPSNSKGSFDTALKNYFNHCNKITWESCVTYNLSIDLKKPEDEGPKEIFRQNVNALLSFTK